MAKTRIAVFVLATTFVGCGYQPAPDRRSDPLSTRDNVVVARQIDALGVSCSPPGPSELSIDNIERYIEVPEYNPDFLSAIARDHPHAVFRTTANHSYQPFRDQDDFNDATMVQVLDRLAHSNPDCEEAKPLGDVAETLRSPR